MTPTTVEEAIYDFRTGEAALRGIARNAGRTRATTRAISRHEAVIQTATQALLAGGHKELVGNLTEEARLQERLSQLPKGQARPELKARKDACSAAVRGYLKSDGAKSLSA